MSRMNEWFATKTASDARYARAAQQVDLAQSLADLVVGLRVQAGLSQAALAELAGTTQATVSLIENGEANPRLGTVNKLLQALVTELGGREVSASVERALFGAPMRVMETSRRAKVKRSR